MHDNCLYECYEMYAVCGISLQPTDHRDGKQMSTSVTKLNSSKNDFERNCVDVFNLTLTNVGVMKRIRIGHDNWGMGADWHLKLVRKAAPTPGFPVDPSEVRTLHQAQ